MVVDSPTLFIVVEARQIKSTQNNTLSFINNAHVLDPNIEKIRYKIRNKPKNHRKQCRELTRKELSSSPAARVSSTYINK